MAGFKKLGAIVVLFLAGTGPVAAERWHECGGRLTEPSGIIQTPNFPHAFPVPIRCRWIIEHRIPNGTILVFFTQQFTTSGLTFTEYMYYDDTYKLGERLALTVTEENITKIKWLKVQSPVLVVELSLDALEGSQLRALGLLAVFGLNVTYTVRAHASQPASCTVLECRLLGHCYATHDYQRFYCSCFEGYSGVDCGEGALCRLSSNTCKNGGICRQMGTNAVSCDCAPGYAGSLCESYVMPLECGIEECSGSCKNGAACDCSPRDSDSTTARFETKLQVINRNSSNLSQEVLNQLTSYLKSSNITLEDDIEMLNISSADKNGGRSAHVRIWSTRKSAGALRAALTRLTTRGRTDLMLQPTTLLFEMHPALSVHTLTVNQRSEVWEGSEFIFSCTAYGSPDIVFTWYKDGVKVNFDGTTRDIWSRTVAEDALGRRISILGVSEAKQIDSGRWSCAANDAGRRRCRALWLTVLRPLDIRLLPSTLTVNKGDNVSITCLAVAERSHGALGFNWAKERSLLPLVPGREVWEDLYPAGSLLKLYNVQKSGEFSCQVSSLAGANSKKVEMWVLSEKDEACEAGAAHGLRWPRTAPGAHAITSCPNGLSGETIRFCESKTSQRDVKWKLPDFSGCISDSLKSIYEQFLLISYGYSWQDVTNVAHQYGAVLRSLPVHPGEGTIPLQHAKEMLNYILSHAAKQRERIESIEHLLKIFDTLLKHPDTFLDEENTFELQSAVAQTVGMKENVEMNFNEFSVISKPVYEDNAAHFKLHQKITGNEEWIATSAGVELLERSGNATVVVIQYHNLASRLPSLRTSIENSNGREMEYVLASLQIQLSANGIGVNQDLQHAATILFTHIHNYTAIASRLECALRSVTEPGTWVTKACELKIPESKHVVCRCRGLGTYGLFTVSKSTLTEAEKDLRGVVKVTVGVGGALCLAAAALQILGMISIRKSKLPILLKATTAGMHSAALLSLLECDTRQEEACPGALGWVCAACWCAGCAALCAQPLLLQAELAGRAQNAPSVALLAGVCILACLTAKLWGGAPLQLWSAAQLVCAAGSALLILLCFALAVCVALRLRVITHKVPAERMNYLKDRRKVVRHTLMLLVTTTAVQVAGIAYAQPGERQTGHVIALGVVAIGNGIAMIVCYVIRDDECLQAARRALSLTPAREWEDSPAGDTSLSLYIKQSGEVESRGGIGMLETPSPMSPIASYWRAPGLDSPRMHRRQSMPDSRADIVRCVEYSVCTSQRTCDVVGCTATSTPDVSLPAPVRSCLKRGASTRSRSLPSVRDQRAPPRIVQINQEWERAYSDHDKVLNKITNDLDFLLNRPTTSNIGVLDEIEEAPT